MKSSVKVFGKYSQQNENKLVIKIGNETLQCTKSVKNLGLELDTDLRFKKDVRNIVQNAYVSLKVLFPNHSPLKYNL